MLFILKRYLFFFFSVFESYLRQVHEQENLTATGVSAALIHDLHLFAMKWGEISPEELSEAAMLEAALFGGNPEGTTNRFHHAPYWQSNQEYTSSPNSVTHHPSPSPTSERLLREQQVLTLLLHL